MDQRTAQHLSEILDKEGKIGSYHLTKTHSKGIIDNFHQWADSKEILGGYHIQSENRLLWLLLIKWRGDHKNEFYLVVFNRQRNLLVEIHKQTGHFLEWRYKPSKQDGRNNLRKEVFIQHLSNPVKLPIPEERESTSLFFNQLFEIIDIRNKADNLQNLDSHSLTEITKTSNMPSPTTFSLNQILYGPPGTGKTYNTINKAVEIIDGSVSDDREEAKARFEELKKAGQIQFTTFHQSMSYEDFVEGIKPVEPEQEGAPVIYRVEEGIFKKLCIEASFDLAKENESAETENVLDFSLIFDNYVQELEERLASEEPDSIELETKNGGKVIVDSISQQGNILVKHPGKSITYAVSKQRLSKLHASFPDLSLVNNIDQEFRAIIGGSNSTVNWAVLNAVNKSNAGVKSAQKEDRKFTWDEKKEVVQSLTNDNYKEKTGNPFVLIIDEINRGNVSQIFGELITLLEEDKRLGRKEAIDVQLTYSKNRFGVPPNIYIIGTMNTADRSVEALDSALRRRFVFEEMSPKPKLLAEIDIEDIDLQTLLETINARIERILDRDHLIGHAYFINIKNLEELKQAFKNKLIPQLQEYFFGDYGKMQLVIGNQFVSKKKNNIGFATSDDFDLEADFSERPVYEINHSIYMDDEAFIEAVMKIYE